ncbi:MAG: response regulator transcription factor, partial [Thermomicrobiales bacterium]
MAEETNLINVLIADDHPVVREGLAAMLSREPDIHVVGEARDGQEAVERAGALRPDIVLM